MTREIEKFGLKTKNNIRYYCVGFPKTVQFKSRIFINFKTVIMKTSKFTPTQIAKILKEFESGKDVDTISREHGVSVMVVWKPASSNV